MRAGLVMGLCSRWVTRRGDRSLRVLGRTVAGGVSEPTKDTAMLDQSRHVIIPTQSYFFNIKIRKIGLKCYIFCIIYFSVT